MALLELEHVGKRRESHVVLDDVSLGLDAGEMVVVWGERRSGRSTLLRVAAGIEPPEAGVVRFAGHDLARRGGQMLGDGISYCRKVFRPSGSRVILEHLMIGQFARRAPRSTALSGVWRALERVGAERCAKLRAEQLSGGEVVRVAIARALTADPLLLVIDEPTIGIELPERDEILSLLRSLADEGIAVLSSAGEGTGLLGADRVLSLGKGKLRGEPVPDPLPVADLGRRQQAG